MNSAAANPAFENAGATPAALGKTETLTIRTPEGVSFSMPLAGPVPRALAWGIDSAFVVLLILGVSNIATQSGIGQGFVYAVTFLIAVAVPALYGIVFEWVWRGQTPGKRLLGIRVVDECGLSLRLSQVATRNLLRAVDMPLPLCFIIGGAAIALTKRCQRLGDLAAGTVVIRLRANPPPEIGEILAGKFNSFRDHPHLEARLRAKATPEEAQLALSAILRRDEFEPEARLALFRDLAGHFRSLVEFPDESAGSLTDEQYLRNVADTLYRRRIAKAGD
ncbi:MAG: RDD family protein [Verrucomicrobiales bacterium]